MKEITIYQFEAFDINSGMMKKSSRWGTRVAIEKIPGAKILEETTTKIDKSELAKEIDGMTDINFSPSKHKNNQTHVE